MFSEPLVGNGEERYGDRDYQGYSHLDKQRNYHNQDNEDREVGLVVHVERELSLLYINSQIKLGIKKKCADATAP